MIFWILYYFFLIFICYLFSKLNKNKFINYFFIPIILGFFGSIWFINPGNNDVAPILSILFLEASILENNGFKRLLRPLITFIFVFQMLSLIIYFFKKLRKK